jgi:nickel/cobalt transporter (NicO) family protein
MSRALSLVSLLALMVIGTVLAFGAGDRIAQWAAALQAQTQTQMAAALRALHAGDGGALLGLWGLCFSYGLAHAMGPGHGKFVLGAYGAARDVGTARMASIAMAASLAQGAMAVALVAVGFAVLGMARPQVSDLAEGAMTQAGLWAALAIGLWLCFRGGRGLWGMWRNHAHHHHDHDTPCPTCGHAHGPSPQAVAAAVTPREVAALIGAIAVRPCSGAIFVLVLTWRMGLIWQGLGAVAAMAIGTGLVTGGVALMAGHARKGAVGWLGRVGPVALVLEFGAGLMVVMLVTAALRG